MPSVTMRSKIRDIGFAEVWFTASPTPSIYTMRSDRLSFQNSFHRLRPLRFGPLLRRTICSRGGFIHGNFRGCHRMVGAVPDSGEAQNEHRQDETDDSFFLRREHEDLAPDRS